MLCQRSGSISLLPQGQASGTAGGVQLVGVRGTAMSWRQLLGGSRRASLRCAAFSLVASLTTLAYNPSSSPLPLFDQAKRHGMRISTAYADHPKEALKLTYIDAATAQAIDDELMGSGGFSLDQLMELAGLSVAAAVNDFASSRNITQLSKSSKRVLIVCGPGNNGGDGLVAARHLKHFGYDVDVFSPVKKDNFRGLRTQLGHLGVTSLETFPSLDNYSLIVDSLFGFSFRGPVREAYAPLLAALASSSTPVISVDLPSGWEVDRGDVYGTGFLPSAVISLTAPKICMKEYAGRHYLGGRYYMQLKLKFLIVSY